MSNIKVMFLGEMYSFPEELSQYVIYTNEFEKISDRLMGKLLRTMKKSPMTGDDCAYTDMREKLEKYMEEEGKKFIKMLSEIGIYDVTESQVIYSNRGYARYMDIKRKMNNGSSDILCNSICSWLDEEEKAYSSAASNIRGTGTAIWTNDFLALATFSAVEYSVLKKQAKQADKEYLQAIDSINRRNTSQTDREYIQFYTKEIYPEIAKAFNIFVSELMDIYLRKLKEKDIYDYTKVTKYQLYHSADLLKNINHVKNEREVLKEAFKACPYNPDIYAEGIRRGLLDIESMKTAKVFHQESMLTDIISSFIEDNLKNSSKIKDYVSVLAYFKGRSETDMLKFFYQKTINRIKNDYRELNLLCTDYKKIDKWIKMKIDSDMDKVVTTSEEDARSKVNSWIQRNVEDSEFAELSNMGLMTVADIRVEDSIMLTLEEVKAEYLGKIVSRIMEYIKEAKVRKKVYEEAYDKFNAQLKKNSDALDSKKLELKQQGIFAFSKKKEIKTEIEQLQRELEDTRKSEPVDLQNAYFKMYG